MKRFSICIALALVATLAACGNQTDRGSVIGAIAKGKLKKQPAGSAQAPDLAGAIAEALQKTDKPLAIAVVENRNGFAILTQIAANNGYRTWASADRRTIVERGGMITATRGLGADLMSASVASSLSRVSARASGATSRTLRFLDGENQTVEAVFSCSAKVTGKQKIAIAEVSSSVTTVTEACTSGAHSYENTYQVAPSGRILQSRQWLGPLNGYLVLQALRL